MKRLSLLFLIVALTLQVQAGVPEPKGVWEFNAPDPSIATAGGPFGNRRLGPGHRGRERRGWCY